MSKNKPVLGILGGMGPLATVDLMRKVIELTPAECDQDHFPMTVVSAPQVPDRTKAILEAGESPLPAMLKGIELLNLAGVSCIAIPCNSAHYWYDELLRSADAPIVHIADSAIFAVKKIGLSAKTVGVLGTSGVLSAEIYQKRLRDGGLDCLVPDPVSQKNQVMEGIYPIKRGQLDRGRDLLSAAAAGLRSRGAEALILGCTEIPIVLGDDDDAVDATLALARASVEFLSREEQT